MRNSELSKILDPWDKLLKEEAGFGLGEVPFLDDVFVELSVLEVLDDEEEVTLGFDDLIADRFTS